MSRILIVPDKFKGTLTAQRAATLIEQGWREARPQDRLDLLPMSDGGDGFGEVLASLSAAHARHCLTRDAAGRPCETTWWWASQTGTAVIESARVIGLALLPPGKFHPFELDTAGLWPLFEAAVASGCTQVQIGIGGSATNDGGFGFGRALGWRFRHSSGTDIRRWTELGELAAIIPPAPAVTLPPVMVAVDVQNPLLGPTGASRVYGPQKGLVAGDFPLAEACLGRLAEIVERDLGLSVANEPGTGAAGGLGFGLRVFAGAHLQSGFELFAAQARLDERVGVADLVITGEGAIDQSSVMGKGVGEIARLCARHRVPCIGLAGTLLPIAGLAQKESPFTRAYGIVPRLAPMEESRADPESWVPRLAALAAREWSGSDRWQEEKG